MKSIALKLDDKVFCDTEDILTKLNKPRNRYINEAVDYYNQVHRRDLLAEKLRSESAKVSQESMSVLKEFEEIDYDGGAI